MYLEVLRRGLGAARRGSPFSPKRSLPGPPVGETHSIVYFLHFYIRAGAFSGCDASLA